VPTDFCYTYRVDQLTGQDRRNDPLDCFAIPVAFVEGRVHRTLRTAIGEIGSAIEFRMPAVLEQITRQVCHDVLGDKPDGYLITSTDATALANKMVHDLLQAGLIGT